MLGPHVIGSLSDHFDRLKLWQPRLILVLDPSPDQVRELRRRCPKTFIIGRVYRPDAEVEQRIRANPKEAARWAHEAIMERFAPEVNAWQVENEVMQHWDSLPLLNEFALERMRLADTHGYKAAILAFSVGNPDLPEHDRLALWRQVYGALAHAEQRDHVVVIHQYGSPSLWDPDSDWYIHRLEHQVLPELPFSQVRFACTEFGIDNLINGYHAEASGWQNTTNGAKYTQDLINIGCYLERYQHRVIGYAVYTLGHTAPWGSYDITGEVADGLANYYQQHPQPQLQLAVPAPVPVPPTPAVQPQPVPLQAAFDFRKREIVQAALRCRVRSTPGLDGEVLGLLEQGLPVYIVDEPQTSGGLIWWKVRAVKSDGARVLGWTAQQDPAGTVLLRRPSSVLANRLQPPFDGTYPITQFFGENQESYLRFGLRGHNGLDLGIIEGIPIKAVDAGWAFQVENDPRGYGYFVKLRHTWGESLYAHLSRFAIQEGQQIAPGQIIGYSGNTGNSTGPHLHLAIRVDPYDLNDGWKGYSDPLPWLPGRCYRLPAEVAAQPEAVRVQPFAVERQLAPELAETEVPIRTLAPALSENGA
jgi:murein DD-endopeptidase MepM/ murein hydrolase activator NlpD